MGKYKTGPEIPFYERWGYWNKILNIARGIYGMIQIPENENPYLGHKLRSERRKNENIQNNIKK